MANTNQEQQQCDSKRYKCWCGFDKSRQHNNKTISQTTTQTQQNQTQQIRFGFVCLFRLFVLETLFIKTGSSFVAVRPHF